jgi:ankyrin repeat protein
MSREHPTEFLVQNFITSLNSIARGAADVGAFIDKASEIFGLEGDLNKAINTDGNSLLHIAAENGCEFAVRELLKAGANINNKRHSDGATPLIRAMLHTQYKVVAELLRHEVDINAALDFDGITAFHIAFISGKADVAIELLERGVDVAKKIDNMSLLDFVVASMSPPNAFNESKIDIALCLISLGAAVSDSTKLQISSHSKITPDVLMNALTRNPGFITQKFIAGEYLFYSSGPGHPGYSMPELAAINGELALFKLAAEAGQDVSKKDSHQLSFLDHLSLADQSLSKSLPIMIAYGAKNVPEGVIKKDDFKDLNQRELFCCLAAVAVRNRFEIGGKREALDRILAFLENDEEFVRTKIRPGYKDISAENLFEAVNASHTGALLAHTSEALHFASQIFNIREGGVFGEGTGHPSAIPKVRIINKTFVKAVDCAIM